MKMIALVDQDWGIGYNGQQNVFIPADLRRFRALTDEKTVIYSEKTMRTFPDGKPLYGRRNVILSHRDLHIDGAEVYHSVQEVLDNVPDDAFVIGGGEIYQAFEPYCDMAFITHVIKHYQNDTFFPVLSNANHWIQMRKSNVMKDGETRFYFATYQKVATIDKPFLLIVGPSGSGKSTVCDALGKYGLTQIASYTTRAPRYPHEANHVFVENYNAWLEEHPYETIVGYTLFAGNDYWATSAQVDENDLYVIDPAGVDYFYRHYDGKKTVRTVYVHAPIWVCMKRMLNRGDTLIASTKRIIGDLYRFREMKKRCDFVVENRDLWRCRDAIMGYILNAKE